MPVRPLDHLPHEITLALLEKLAPGSLLLSIELLPGSYSNHTHLVEMRLPDGTTLKCVVRRYQEFGDYDRGEKARREFKAFELMSRRGIPSPKPLLLDDTGILLGAPGIVTCFVPGTLILSTPPDPLGWAQKLAKMLARIHATPMDDDSCGFLLDANSEATWFLKNNSVPDFMKAYPGGADLWQAARDSFSRLQPVPSSLVHLDYWSGNILWKEGEISAVLDWEEAACGDPTIDLAYARLDMTLMGLPETANEFLRIYEAETGYPAKNLGFWELAAAARPMFAPADWKVSESPGMDSLHRFIAEAMMRLK